MGEKFTPRFLRALATTEVMHKLEVLRNVIQALSARNQTLLRGLLRFFDAILTVNTRSSKAVHADIGAFLVGSSNATSKMYNP